MRRIAILTSLALLSMAVIGCTDWDKVAYQTLATSKAVIDQAQSDYNNKAIPQTQANYNIIAKANGSQNKAVNALLLYEEAKAAGGTTASLTALQSDVTTDLALLPALIQDVKGIYQEVK